MTRAELEAEVARLGPWWHTIALPEGVVTPGGCDPASSLQKLQMPESLDGQTVLDLGCAEGYYSLEAALRGGQVTAVDINPHNIAKLQFCAKALGLEQAVRGVVADVLDLTADYRANVVLCLGLLYKFAEPMEVMRRVGELTSQTLVFETLADAIEHVRPKVTLYDPADPPNGAPENVSAPNPAWCQMALREVGFAFWQQTFVSNGPDPHRPKKRLQRVGYRAWK